MTNFIRYVESTERKIQECVLFVLFWIAVSDDQLDKDEVLFMSSHFGFENLSTSKVEKMRTFIKYAVAEDFRFVMDVLRGLDRESKDGLLTDLNPSKSILPAFPFTDAIQYPTNSAPIFAAKTASFSIAIRFLLRALNEYEAKCSLKFVDKF